MFKPNDVTTKDLLKRDPPAWMGYFRLNPGGLVHSMDTDLSTITAQADQVYRVAGRRSHLIHIEMQSSRHAALARRLWRYNAMLDLKYNLRVRSIAVLLRPEADSAKLTGLLELRLPDGDEVVKFYNRVIRAWQQPVGPILTGPLATLPMAALADVPIADVPRVLEQIDSRLAAEAPPADAVRMMTSALTLAGMRLDAGEIDALTRRLPTMNILKDSSFYPVLKEWAAEAREHHGELKGIRKTLIRQGRIRFGRLDKGSRARIEAIDDLDRLELLSERLLSATSWADLLKETN
jgi:hypothetical protein